MKQKTEYVVTLTSGESLGSLTKREADKMIRDTPSKIIGVEKKVWRGEDGWFDLWAEDSYWVNPDAPEPEPVKLRMRKQMDRTQTNNPNIKVIPRSQPQPKHKDYWAGDDLFRGLYE